MQLFPSSTKVSLVLVLFLTISMSKAEEVSRRMVGGYSKAKSGTSTKNSKEIKQAVTLVLDELQQGQHPNISFYSKLQLREGEGESLKAIPLSVSQQVVAGLNYKMKIGIFIQSTTIKNKTRGASGTGTERSKHEQCLGGISATVFRDLKGGYAVTKWGEEIDCENVVAMLNEKKGEE